MNLTILKSPQSKSISPLTDITAQLADAVGSRRVWVAAETILCAPNAPIGDVYALCSGQVEVRNRAGERLAVIGAGSLIGALEVWTRRNWGVTAQAASECEVIALAAESFRQLLRINPLLRQAAGQAVTVLMRRVQMAEVLARALGDLPSGLLELVASEARWRHLDRGERLLQQDEESDSLFLLIGGRLQRRYRSADGTERTAGMVNVGESVGSFLTTQSQPATTLALRESLVLELPAALCQKLWQRFPHSLLPFLQQAASQQRNILTSLDARPAAPTTLALIPASADLPIEHFAEQLAAAMQISGVVRILTRRAVDDYFGQKRVADIPPEHPMHPLLVDWLNAQEATAQHILYVADPAWSGWTRRCLRQADRLLIVADAQADPTPTLIEQAIYAQSGRAQSELVLLHPPTVDQPRGTAAWLDQRPIETHYHVRQNDHAHFASLARRLTGKAVAVVLSGGGARGIAHLGLLRVMEERGLAWDLVGGASMGALIAVTFAFGWRYAEALQRATHFGNPKSFLDYTLPLVSLFASNKVTEMIRATVGDQQIEDLWRPYFAISTDLTEATMIVHRQGPLWRAVRASLSIPAVFAPLIDERGHLLIDGGVMNNFPVDVMRQQMGSGTIIGVDVGGANEVTQQYGYETGVSGWQVLRSRLTPGGEAIDAPLIASIMVRTMMLNNQQQVRRAQQLCDILIRPDVRRFGTLQFEKYVEIVEAGYTAASACLHLYAVSHW